MTATRAAMSFAGAVGFGKEAAGAYGVAVSRTDWLIAESAQPTVHRPEVAMAAIANGWETLETAPGNWEVGVNIGVDVYAAAAIQNLILAVLERAPLDSSTYTPGQPYSYTVELVMDNGSSILITGCRAGQGQFSVKPSDKNKLTVDFMGKAASVIESTSPSPSVGAMYHGGYTVLKINGVSAPLTNSFDVTIANNANRRYSFTGDGTARTVKASNQLITGNLGADFETTDLLDSFIAREDTEFVVTTTAADGSAMVITVPIARFNGDDPGLNGGNSVEDKLTWIAKKDSGAGYVVAISVNADTTAPTLSVVPADAATGVAIGANVVWTASEDLRTSSVGTHSVVLLKDGVAEVAGAVALVNNGASTTITFNPTADLENSTAYTAVVTTEVRDTSGNRLAATKVTNFTTVAP